MFQRPPRLHRGAFGDVCLTVPADRRAWDFPDWLPIFSGKSSAKHAGEVVGQSESDPSNFHRFVSLDTAV